MVGDTGESLFEEVGGAGDEGDGIVSHGPLGQHVLLEDVKPSIDHAPQSAVGGCGGGESLHETAVDRFQFVEGSLRLGDLHFAGHEAPLPGPVGKPAGEKRLPAAIVAPNRLEDAPPPGHGVEIGIDGRFEAIEADTERIEARPRHGAATEGIDDLTGPFRRNAHRVASAPAGRPNCTRRSCC